MKQNVLFEAIPTDKFDLMSKEDLITFATLEQEARIKLQKDNDRLRALHGEMAQQIFYIDERYITIKNMLFGKSSEKSPKVAQEKPSDPNAKEKKKKIQLPSVRYPDAKLIERHVELQDLPSCKCCGTEMVDSGMTEDAEFLTVIPAEFIVVRQLRHKYSCTSCYGDVQTAPAPPTIKAGSSYSDEMKIDVALSKYCDLIPIERYTSIAGRAGLTDLPPQSLIESTHHVADYLKGVFDLLKADIMQSKVLHADETPHKMLEGDAKNHWYLWSFSNGKSSYFDIRDTRAGEVASEVLKQSQCQYLMTDAFSGYARDVKDTNEVREKLKLPLIKNIYCNAHSRRKFNDAKSFPEESTYFKEHYREIYHLEKQVRGQPPDEILKQRQLMRPYFECMKIHALEIIDSYSSQSTIVDAMTYFLKHYKELTLFLDNPDLPIDNNAQERQLRNAVIGRKTWCGTHSKRGVRTAAILFSIIESCKLCGVNPREYFKAIVRDLHAGKEPYTPWQFKNRPEPV